MVEERMGRVSDAKRLRVMGGQLAAPAVGGN